jgi:ABC-type cobalamin/Fe3+-siderophores transport system ATPase subunit
VIVLRATGVAVGRGASAVLAGVCLQVARGQRVALVGANGAGKTTLLRALAGLDRVRAGEVVWGRDGGLGPLPAGAARVSTVGVLFQRELASPFTVRALVTLGLGLDHPPGAGERAAVEAALLRVGLQALAERTVATLSGGEAQRAALARALVARPALLLLDEPTNHLDPARRAELLGVLDELREELGVVLATHDLDCAASADHVVLLGEGGVLAAGPPRAVLTTAHLRRTFGVPLHPRPSPLAEVWT